MRVRVGLTGGIGAGKTEAAKAFARFGALVIDADALAREAVSPGSSGLAEVRRLWPQVVASDERLDRKALASVVFRDVDALEALGAIIHPFVRARSLEIELGAEPNQIVVHDVPLLFEAGFYRACDANIVVIADVETRLRRLSARSGFDEGEVKRRIRAQIDPDRARELADYTLLNDGTPLELELVAREVYDELLERRPRGNTSP